MLTSLHRFLDPANYHHDALAAAQQGDMVGLAPSLLVLRLCLELHTQNWNKAHEAVSLLEPQGLGRYGLFQLKTAMIILALIGGGDNEILSSIHAWLAARKCAPENFINDVLGAPELASILLRIDPALLVKAIVKPRPITKADRAMVRDFGAARLQAVSENLEWLRPLGVTGSIKAIAWAYRIVHADHHLHEVTLGNNKNWPELVLALDENGDLLGSFIAH